jgi:hypothetical protein
VLVPLAVRGIRTADAGAPHAPPATPGGGDPAPSLPSRLPTTGPDGAASPRRVSVAYDVGSAGGLLERESDRSAAESSVAMARGGSESKPAWREHAAAKSSCCRPACTAGTSLAVGAPRKATELSELLIATYAARQGAGPRTGILQQNFQPRAIDLNERYAPVEVTLLCSGNVFLAAIVNPSTGSCKAAN